MPSSVAELIEQLADVKQRNAASEELVRRGAEAVPALLGAADGPSDTQHFKVILRALLAIKDPRAETVFRRAMESTDPETRAIAARGLYVLHAPDALDALQTAINDAPDPLHFEQTPAVQSLIELGTAALTAVFALMESADARTRQRAQYILANVMLRDITRRLQPRPLTSDAQQAWEELRQANGSYQWDGPEPARRASIALWRQWARERNE